LNEKYTLIYLGVQYAYLLLGLLHAVLVKHGKKIIIKKSKEISKAKILNSHTHSASQWMCRSSVSAALSSVVFKSLFHPLRVSLCFLVAISFCENLSSQMQWCPKSKIKVNCLIYMIK
jgi:hypothetical protein